jgi:hypothetical protein
VATVYSPLINTFDEHFAMYRPEYEMRMRNCRLMIAASLENWGLLEPFFTAANWDSSGLNERSGTFVSLCRSPVASRDTYIFHTSVSYVTTHSVLRLYRMFQEERSIFSEVMVSVFLSKKVYIYMCPIPNGFRDRAISLYGTQYTVQTTNTPCPHTSCKVN